MNNIHIIHGIQYLQNIKYNTSCTKLIFCTQLVQISTSVPILLKSPGFGENYVLHTYGNLSLNF